MNFSRTDASGEPAGDFIPFAIIVSPFDEVLQNSSTDLDTDQVEVQGVDSGHTIKETYIILETGMITATSTDVGTGWSTTAIVGRLTTTTGMGRGA